MDRKNIILTIAVLLLTSFVTAFGGDWYTWRGPNRNGIVDDADWNPLALSGNPNTVWEADLGLGYSAVAVKDGRLYALGNKEIISGTDTVGVDIVYCLDALTGAEIWRYSYLCTTDHSWPGPTASPVLDGDRLYTLCDDTGDLLCLNAKNGHVHWKLNVVEAFGTVPPYDGVGYAGSPYIEGDLILFNLNTAGIALNKYTGETVWASESGRCSFSTPVVFDHDQKRKMALFGAKYLFILDPSTGEVEGSYHWETSANENTADPIIYDDHVFISSAYGQGCAFLKLTGGNPELVWKSLELRNQFTSSVLIDGFVYGIDGHRPRCSLKCIDIRTGEVAWSERMPFASLIAADGKLIVLDENGVVHIVGATPDAFRELSSGKVQRAMQDTRGSSRNRKFWWSNPVLVDGYLYVRCDKGDLVCMDLSG